MGGIDIKEYICTKELCLDVYDDDGFYIENKVDYIDVGEIFQECEDKFRMVGSKDSIRLDSDKHWIEISKETLNEYFKPYIHFKVGNYIPCLNTYDSDTGETISFSKFKDWEYKRNDDGTVTFILRNGVPYE